VNDDNVLQAGEITTTAYVCQSASGANGAQGAAGANGANGANGAASLFTLNVEAAGSNCTYGGNKMLSGVDTNGDGQLDNGETITTSYICNGAPGAQGAPGAIGETGTSTAWTTVTAAVSSMAANTGYVANSAGTGVAESLTLPDSSTLTIGDLFSVSGAGSDGWQLAAASGSPDIIFTKALPASYKRPLNSLAATTSSSASHQSVAVSNDGLVIVATSLTSDGGPGVEISHDGGRTWGSVKPSSGDFYYAAISANGKLILVTDNSGAIYRSTDSGSTFRLLYTAPTGSITSMAASADGSDIVITQGGANMLMLSHDAGANWAHSGATSTWYDILTGATMSADGSHIALFLAIGTEIGFSTDGGATFSNLSATNTGELWKYSGTSADGQYVLAASTRSVWLSTDYGQTYRKVYAVTGSNIVNSIAVSGDGQTLALSVNGGTGAGLKSSTDGGTTWSSAPNTNKFISMALAHDGSRLFAAGSTVSAISTAANDRTSLAGAGGYLRGTQGDNITIQYQGGNTFVPVSYYSQYSDFIVN
jgi:hypothetical protein